MEWLKDLGSLGPQLGSVAVIGIVCWRLLQLFDKLASRLDGNITIVNRAIEVLNHAVASLTINVEKNTEATERVTSIIERQYEYVPRQSPTPKQAGQP